MSFLISLFAFFAIYTAVFLLFKHFDIFQRTFPPLLRTIYGLCIALLISSVDFFIYVYQDSVSSEVILDHYIDWFAYFAVYCAAFSFIISYFTIIILRQEINLFTALISGVMAYILVYAGLADATFGALFPYGNETSISDFIENLSNLSSLTSDFTDEWFLKGIVIYPLSTVSFLFILYRPTKLPIGNPINSSELGETTMAFKNSSNEPLRLAAGLAACGRLPGQSALESEIGHPAQATPFPIDIDRNVILSLVQLRKSNEVKQKIFYTILSLVAYFITIEAETPLGIMVAIVVATIFYSWYSYRDKYKIAPQYKPEAFEKTTKLQIPQNNQNLIVYSGNSPFLNFGFVFGSWILSVDKERAQSDNILSGGTASVTSPDIHIIKQSICTSLKQSGIIDTDINTLYFVQGKNIPSRLKKQGPHKPPTQINTESIAELIDNAESQVREYVWIRKPGWNNEISTSYFLRVLENEGDLNLEIVGVFMPPISDQFRWIDKIPPKSFRQFLADLFVSVIAGSAMLIWSPIYLAGLIQNSISKAFFDPKKTIRRSIVQQPDYDFGATIGLRKQMSDINALSYFQDSDRKMAETAFTGRILRSFIDALDKCNIDTSELREQRTTLLNQGIIVQGGDLKAKNVAAGLGSRINSMTSKMSGNSKRKVSK